MSKIYYNEIEPFACHWLEHLMADGFIAEGHIDNRSIRDIQPEELEGYTQCHFFAGIGVWSYALRQAGWSDDRPIWTGSCPCQPFSQAGLHKGDKDDRHLWPEFHRLIKECRPSAIIGEQVSGKGGFQFFDLLQTNLEAENYSATAVDLGAHSAGTTHSQGFHKRQRLYWVAENLGHSAEIGRGRWAKECRDHKWESGESVKGDGNAIRNQSGRRVETVSMANANSVRQESLKENDDRQTKMDESKRPTAHLTHDVGCSDSVSMADTHSQRSQGSRVVSQDHRHTEGRTEEVGFGATDSEHCGSDNQNDSGWNYDLIWCRDQKWRPVECGTYPMADATPNRIHILKAVGNAIPADTAKIFIESYMESVVDRHSD